MFEIERKYLLKNNDMSWLTDDIKKSSKKIQQYYFKSGKIVTLRVRIINGDYLLTVKSKKQGIKCIEVEKSITKEEGDALISVAHSKIEKVRYLYPYKGKTFEIDVFDNGFVLIECELEDENESIDLPYFIGEEVSEDNSYSNSKMAKKITK